MKFNHQVVKGRQDLGHREKVITFSSHKEVPYLVKRSKRRKKTISIKIDADGSVVVLCPWKTPTREIEQLLEEKKNWIFRSLAKHQKAKRFSSSVQNGKLVLLGEEYLLKYSWTSRKVNRVKIRGNAIIIESNVVSDADKKEEKIRRILIEWLRKRLEEVIIERVQKFQQIMHVQPKEIKIRKYKARWGSHNGRGILTFNLFLVMAPLRIIDYVVVHELAHLLENNHSKKFWQQVERVLPDYKQRRKWLKENGVSLRI